MSLELQVVESQAPHGWDELLQTCPQETGFEQTALWAAILKELDHAHPFFLRVVLGADTVASLLVFHQIPWDRTRQEPKRGLRQLIRGSYRGWLMWHGGPTLYTKDRQLSAEALDLLLTWLNDYARKRKLIFIQGAFAHRSNLGKTDYVRSHFEGLGYQLQNWGTYQVDLTPDEDKLWSSLKAAARKSVKRAQREGLTVAHVQTLDELKSDYYAPYQAFEAAAGRAANPWSSAEVTWRLDEKKRYRFYVARDPASQVMAVLGMHIFNGVATEIASSLNPKAFDKKLPAQDLLHWEMMLEAKRSRAECFDLAGVAPQTEGDKESGIRRFKEKWGGQYLEYPIYHKSLGWAARHISS